MWLAHVLPLLGVWNEIIMLFYTIGTKRNLHYALHFKCSQFQSLSCLVFQYISDFYFPLGIWTLCWDIWRHQGVMRLHGEHIVTRRGEDTYSLLLLVIFFFFNQFSGWLNTRVEEKEGNKDVVLQTLTGIWNNKGETVVKGGDQSLVCCIWGSNPAGDIKEVQRRGQIRDTALKFIRV